MPSGTVITIDYGFPNTGSILFRLYINDVEVDSGDLNVGWLTKTYDYTVTSDIDILVMF